MKNSRHSFGIDLGTGTVKLFDRSSGQIIKERNLIAIREPDVVFAVGNEAYEIYEKNPMDIRIIHPMHHGLIHDVLMMEAVLHTMLQKCRGLVGYRPSLVFSVPLDMTELERRAYSTIARKGRFRRSRIFFVEKPIADAVDLGLPIHRAEGSMLLNIGAQSSEISILADGRILVSRLLTFGGEDLSAAIVEGVRDKNNLQISLRTAQRLKFTLTNLLQDPGEGCKVSGLDRESGLPRDGIISSYTVSRCVQRALQQLIEDIRKMLDRIPPQIQTSIHRDGLYVTGGCAHLAGLGGYLERMLEIPVHVSESCEYGTVSGLQKIIAQPELHHWASLQTTKQRSRFGGIS